MNKFYNNKIEEQETIIAVDYSNKAVNCYTSRKTQIEKLTKELGEPTHIDYINKKICSASWTIPFSEKSKLSKVIFSRPTIIGQL